MNNDLLIIYHHGWAGDDSYFKDFSNELLKFFSFDSIFLDYGYFSNDQELYENQLKELKQKQSNYKKTIFITHSVGLIKTIEISLKFNLKFDSLISFGGFLKFVNSKIDLEALNLTIKKFEEHKIEFIRSFNATGHKYINYNLLMKDLLFLRESNKINMIKKLLNIIPNLKLFNIYAGHDPILGSIKSINQQNGFNLFEEKILQLSNSHFIPKHDTNECVFITKNIIQNEIFKNI